MSTSQVFQIENYTFNCFKIIAFYFLRLKYSQNNHYLIQKLEPNQFNKNSVTQMLLFSYIQIHNNLNQNTHTQTNTDNYNETSYHFYNLTHINQHVITYQYHTISTDHCTPTLINYLHQYECKTHHSYTINTKQ